jgi:hypothetical protein
MKKIYVVMGMLLFFFVADGQPRAGNSAVPIGTIITTVLDYPTFAALNGQSTQFADSTSAWAPADGRSVAHSLYAKSGSKTVPDLRGLFLRGRNQFYPGDTGTTSVGSDQADPEGVRKAGGPVEADAVGPHNHTIEVYRDSRQNGTRQAASSGGFADMPEFTRTTHYAYGTNPSDLVETRPKNVAVFYYIRIN